ncbi:hypothetical protein EN836_27885 [Mesorhizobium sp. M1C.F.Ca.ET.193.01.1.1]|nr:hypothetical protein EN853_27880 [Mesorhizobium sp. M1C.F.Ca.ET.210.01.1.1]TGQ65876.1 hypothetical protein EN855_027890 [Mesorhizobium sp. M1C.F.Ca.ET.212.01.1.1]TGQ99881.1 hypothetical protein EN847_27880 [Mesorhizobium sp. M1C.F.Ca.ET.204.01.1.1]TGR20415.1 hypothetical protein EN839_27880 [Mesorhizobium sp. M1C.F.Ca.ET.196.01.1.1]TGR43089.1 hypothetical protein EN838_27880 [Mesorhizobium sp. M1C.F.Ca.ET.195.01.1.1]TGR61673.1 hypothetical protein EN835_027875 [Mesorhizobium sp. M1C.F.Ca.ET
MNAGPRDQTPLSVMGYGGNDIDVSQIASELVSTSIAGAKDTDAGLARVQGMIKHPSSRIEAPVTRSARRCIAAVPYPAASARVSFRAGSARW